MFNENRNISYSTFYSYYRRSAGRHRSASQPREAQVGEAPLVGGRRTILHSHAGRDTGQHLLDGTLH